MPTHDQTLREPRNGRISKLSGAFGIRVDASQHYEPVVGQNAVQARYILRQGRRPQILITDEKRAEGPPHLSQPEVIDVLPLRATL